MNFFYFFYFNITKVNKLKKKYFMALAFINVKETGFLGELYQKIQKNCKAFQKN